MNQGKVIGITIEKHYVDIYNINKMYKIKNENIKYEINGCSTKLISY